MADDLKVRLAQALWERLPQSEVLGPIYVKEMASVLADAALSLPGIAIVELPELALFICSGCMRYMRYCTKSPCDDRAALLAAANAAEKI